MILTFRPERYSRSILTTPQTEAQVQAAIERELDRRKIPHWHLDAGGKRTRKERGETFGAGGVADIPAGWPDIMGILPDGRALFCEVKRPGVYCGNARIQKPGTLSKDQVAFLAKAEAAGAVCLVAWSLSDLITVLDHPMQKPGKDRKAWAEAGPKFITPEAREEKRDGMARPALKRGA